MNPKFFPVSRYSLNAGCRSLLSWGGCSLNFRNIQRLHVHYNVKVYRSYIRRIFFWKQTSFYTAIPAGSSQNNLYIKKKTCKEISSGQYASHIYWFSISLIYMSLSCPCAKHNHIIIKLLFFKEFVYIPELFYISAKFNCLLYMLSDYKLYVFKLTCI